MGRGPLVETLSAKTARIHFHRTVVLRQALFFAVPCALFALGLKQLAKIGYVQQNKFMYDIAQLQVINNSAAYSGFSLVLGFLVVFRTQLAYNRFWEGISAAHRMCAEWFDGASSVLAFTKISKADRQQVLKFQSKFIRFLSLLHGIAVSSLRDLEDLQLDEDDLDGLSLESIEELRESPYPATVVFQWVQDIMAQAMDDRVLSVPPPVLSRVFNEIANGMVAYHDCMKIQATNVPLPYRQMTVILMAAHWFITPVVMCMWTEWETWAFIFTLIQSMIFWCLYFTAHQIEFPFQTGEISYSVINLHHEFITNLLAMVMTRTGQLVDSPENQHPAAWLHQMKSFDELNETHLEKRLAIRKRAVTKVSNPNKGRGTGSPTNQNPLVEGSVLVKIEALCEPQMESGGTWVANPDTSEQGVSEPIPESNATNSLEKQPSKEAVHTGAHETLHRKQRSSSPDTDNSFQRKQQVKSLAPRSCVPVNNTRAASLDRAFEEVSYEDIDEGGPSHVSSMRFWAHGKSLEMRPDLKLTQAQQT